ncbi:hypothetical protein MPTK1_2g07670 [Marchantia polymorpha subsp. ruderalis]|uniref:CCDC93 coiled-coil domain-containing protein n=1 Tax=Marchantia polymorpha TaxID=3197 RepID=A0A2R6XGK9_MARPO|nr:hypothetical protein MARPO_0015s0053 [Marchantia polymorpha]PTQ45245.1 hypothetical protein MARPO_0015s0053 [Marchantia polymorpha]BBN01477.1 hypothetical protein Mp_2g07670 [Marchantia polymorpha subsp. ruderalis]BBN01478.1 hypothetical protein Mp_2g07670 [Marchantia polymorpha subsp. ruderalis]|eukprot:PTQ45244.1 hypothetical protein MARPO_0015s0053 [Marchantia polymorpha]
MEDDGERTQLLQKILDLLLAGGYFRARISALSVFDKLTGGLAWCITFSKVDVDFDIFYDDDATLYYKIKVGEAIEEALQRMGCPHPLQAHQIQGLDYQAVLPVVKWLVKRVLATLEEFGDQARRYAHLRYQENYKLPDERSLQQARLEKIEAVVQASSQQSVRQLYQLARVNAQSSLQDIPTSKAELDQLTSSRSGDHFSAIARSDVVQASKGDKKTNVDHTIEVLNLEKKIGGQDMRINQLQTKASATLQSLKEMDETIIHQNHRIASAQSAIQELQFAAEVAGAESVVQKLMGLLERSQILEKKESDFRSECRRKRSEMQLHIKQLHDPSVLPAEDDERGAEINNAYNADLQKWKLLRSELSKKNRAITLLQRRLGEIPSQTELMQYERRFVELYLHIQRKLRETRKYFATYNALAEANELTVKELSLLNSIHSQFEVAMMTPGGRAKFVSSMEGIANGVQQKLDQIERRFESEQSTFNALKEKHTAAVTAQRQYYALVKLFQEECARSDKLQAKVEKASHI